MTRPRLISVLVLVECTVKAAENRIILQHINHIVEIHISVIDCCDLELFRLCSSDSDDDSADPSISVDTNSNRHFFLLVTSDF